MEQRMGSRDKPSSLRSSSTTKKNKLSSASVENGIKVVRFGVYFVLCSLAAGIGSATFLIIRNAEYASLNTQYSSSCTLLKKRVGRDITRKFFAADLVHKIYASASDSGFGGVFPYLTLPGFQSSMEIVLQLAQLRFIAVSPLITNTTRPTWEAYATANVALLDSTSLPPNSSTTGSTYLISNGIANRTEAGEIIRNGDYIYGSSYPTIFFPTWQTTRSKLAYLTVMIDPHSSPGTRLKSIDGVIATKKVVFTDIVQLIRDGNITRYSTLIYGPILSLEPGNPMVGLFQGGFSWDAVFSNITFESILIVLETDTTILSYLVGEFGVTLLGTGASRVKLEVV